VDFGAWVVVGRSADLLERWSVGDLVESLALVVEDLAAQASLGGPLFDGGGAHADHAAGLEAVLAGGESVAAADVADDPGGERLVGAGGDPGVVEGLGSLGVGVVVQEPVDCGDDRRWGAPQVRRGQWEGDGEAVGLAAFEAHVHGDGLAA